MFPAPLGEMFLKCISEDSLDHLPKCPQSILIYKEIDQICLAHPSVSLQKTWSQSILDNNHSANLLHCLLLKNISHERGKSLSQGRSRKPDVCRKRVDSEPCHCKDWFQDPIGVPKLCDVTSKNSFQANQHFWTRVSAAPTSGVVAVCQLFKCHRCFVNWLELSCFENEEIEWWERLPSDQGFAPEFFSKLLWSWFH